MRSQVRFELRCDTIFSSTALPVDCQHFLLTHTKLFCSVAFKFFFVFFYLNLITKHQLRRITWGPSTIEDFLSSRVKKRQFIESEFSSRYYSSSDLLNSYVCVTIRR